MKIQQFNRYLELEEVPSMIKIFLEKGKVRTCARNEFFLKEGQRCDQIGYIAEGGFRHLIHASDSLERIAGYSFKGDFVTAFQAFDSPASAVSIQAYKESTLYMLPSEEVFSYQTWEYRCKVAEISLTDVYGKLLLMHCGTPEERYRSLIGRYPPILNEVPLKEIASFLRMTPETLSRIRKKILKNENS